MKSGPKPRPLRHGTLYAYNKGCRCDECRTRKAADGQQYYRANRERVLAQCRGYRQATRIRKAERDRAWYDRNRERKRAYDREYRHREAERLKRQTPAFMRRRAQNQRQRNERAHNAQGSATPAQVSARFAFFGGRCWMCRELADTMDHVIPLLRGGTGWASNLRPACRSCNSAKGAR